MFCEKIMNKGFGKFVENRSLLLFIDYEQGIRYFCRELLSIIV